MKRSELIKEIEFILTSNYDYPAVTILQKLEELGVQAPAVKEPCESFVLHNGQYIKVADSFVFTHKWDEE